MEVLVNRMTDTKDGRGLREDKEWHRGRGDTGGSVGEENDRHKGWEGLERRQGVAQREERYRWKCW